MFLSVSMPIYNASKYLDKSISSIMNQSEKEFELILVDDGSTDESVSICKEWEKKYPEVIRVIEKTNSGSLLTRRRCLEESRGDYIYVMDADDYLIDPDAFKKMRTAIENSGCDMLFFDCTTKIEEMASYFKFPFENGTIFFQNNRVELLKYYIKYSGLKPLWNKVFHRDLVDWDEDYSKFTSVTNGTDYFQSTPIVNNAKLIYCLNEILYFYRTDNNEKSIVHTFKKTIFISGKANFERLVYYSNLWGIPQNELKSLLNCVCMKMISTSAYKARLIDSKCNISAIDYLAEIREDPIFNQYYNLQSVNDIKRKIILFLLRHRRYKVLIKAFMLFK